MTEKKSTISARKRSGRCQICRVRCRLAFEHHDYDPGRPISQRANDEPPRNEHPENVDRSIFKDLHTKSVPAHF